MTKSCFWMYSLGFKNYVYVPSKIRIFLPIVFFIAPYSATAIFNIEIGSRLIGVQPWVFFTIISILFMPWIVYPSRGTLFRYFGVFLIAILVSNLILAIVPVKNSYLVPELYKGDVYFIPTFDVKNVTQTVYIIIGLAFSQLVSNYVSQNFKPNIDKILICSTVFACLLGYLQVFAKILEFPYLVEWLRNSSSEFVASEMDQIHGFYRVSSLFPEPSLFAQFTGASLVYWLTILRGRHASFASYFLWILCFISMLHSMTTTSVVTIVLLLLIFYVPKAMFLFILLFTLFGFFAFLNINYFQDYLFDKNFSYSLSERFFSILIAYEIFKDYPLLGVGWGSVTSHDLFFNLFANSGILGFSTFFYAVLKLFRKYNCCLKSVKDQNSLIDLNASFYAFATMLVMSILSGFGFVFAPFWLFLGLFNSKLEYFYAMNKKSSTAV